MPGRRVKKNPRLDAELKMRLIAVLDEVDDSVMPTLEWIKKQDIILAPHTTQKLSRILNTLIEMGLVRKAKSKSLNRMVYRLTSKMIEAGYEDPYSDEARTWNGVDWELEDEITLYEEEEL